MVDLIRTEFNPGCKSGLTVLIVVPTRREPLVMGTQRLYAASCLFGFSLFLPSYPECPVAHKFHNPHVCAAAFDLFVPSAQWRCVVAPEAKLWRACVPPEKHF